MDRDLGFLLTALFAIFNKGWLVLDMVAFHCKCAANLPGSGLFDANENYPCHGGHPRRKLKPGFYAAGRLLKMHSHAISLGMSLDVDVPQRALNAKGQARPARQQPIEYRQRHSRTGAAHR
jgi:hypothetical protein